MHLNHMISIFKALADRNRLRILAALIHCSELCACQLIELIQVTGSTISRHMQLLMDAGIVSSRKEGRWVYYQFKVDDPEKDVLVRWLKETMMEHKEMEDDAKVLEAISTCDLTELCKRQRQT